MREIKFRAWTGEQMVILENSGLQYFDFEGSYSLGFTVDAYSDFWAHEQYKSASKEAEKFPIMQFTGVKDINGKEIFEGDILFSEDWNPKRQEVTFDRGGFCLKHDESGYYPDIKYAERMAIVGNIHENPSLKP